MNPIKPSKFSNDKNTSGISDICWERDACGRFAMILNTPMSTLGEKYCALSMLRGVTRISAEFSGTYALYRRALIVCVDNQNYNRMTAIYANEDEQPGTPAFALRTGGYSYSHSKIMAGRIIFPLGSTKAIQRILTELQSLAVNEKLVLEKTPRNSVDWVNLFLCLEYESLTATLEYAVNEFKNTSIEAICYNCLDLGEKSVSSEEWIPDASYGVRISFDPLFSANKIVPTLNAQTIEIRNDI